LNRYKELKVWQKGIELASFVYEITESYPSKEVYGLSSQSRRCAVSIPSNIAEGAGRNSNREFLHFLSISVGSIFELETQLIISQRLNYISVEKLEILTEHIEEIKNMLFGLQKSIEIKEKKQSLN
jgi:four helix bundle protein